MPSLNIERAEHDEFILSDGSRLYDFISTSFQASFGHSNQPIVDHITRQLHELPICTPKGTFSLKERVSRELISLTGQNQGKVFYTVSGAESVENAIKMARRVTGRPIILARKKSYHGASLGAMSVSGDWRSDEHLTFDEGTARIPEPDVDPNADGVREVIEQVGPERIAAIIVETISGTNGVVIPPPGWFAGLRKICDQWGLILILDEVLVGFCRCQTPFAFQSLDAKPDMICMSKAITGGYIPFGAVWVSQSIAQFYDDQILIGGLTNYAHPLGLAAMGAVLDQINERTFRENLTRLEAVFQDGVQSIAQTFNASAVRIQGMLAAIEFGDRELPPWTTWVANGLYLFTKGNMMILAPPLVSEEKRLDEAFEKMRETLRSA